MNRIIACFFLIFALIACREPESIPMDAQAQPLEYTELHQLTEARMIDESVVFDNKIFFIGGIGDKIDGNCLKNNVDIYDLNSGSWSVYYMSQEKTVSKTVICDGKLFLIGGFTRADMASYIDIYDSKTHDWSRLATDFSLGSVTAVVANNKIYLVNVMSTEANNPKNMLLDPESLKMTYNFLNDSIREVGVAVVGTEIFFAGGYYYHHNSQSITSCKNVDILNVETNEWIHDSLSLERAFITVFASNDRVYFAGGEFPFSTFTNTVDVFDLKTRTWTMTEMPIPGALVNMNQTSDLIYFNVINEANSEWPLLSFHKSTGVWDQAELPPLGGTRILYANDNYVVTQRANVTYPCLDICRLSDRKWFVIKLNNSHPFPSKVVIAGDRIFLAGGYLTPGDAYGNEPVYSAEVNIFSLN